MYNLVLNGISKQDTQNLLNLGIQALNKHLRNLEFKGFGKVTYGGFVCYFRGGVDSAQKVTFGNEKVTFGLKRKNKKTRGHAYRLTLLLKDRFRGKWKTNTVLPRLDNNKIVANPSKLVLYIVKDFWGSDVEDTNILFLKYIISFIRRLSKHLNVTFVDEGKTYNLYYCEVAETDSYVAKEIIKKKERLEVKLSNGVIYCIDWSPDEIGNLYNEEEWKGKPTDVLISKKRWEDVVKSFNLPKMPLPHEHYRITLEHTTNIREGQKLLAQHIQEIWNYIKK